MIEMNGKELSTIRGNMTGIFKSTCALEDAAKNLKVQSNSKSYTKTSTLDMKATKSATKVSTMKDDDIQHQPAFIKGYITIWMVLLIISVIMFMQIPNVLYYTKPSPGETFLLNIFDLEHCSVNIPETFQNSSKFVSELVTTCKNLNMHHNFAKSEANNSMVLQYIYYLSVLLENSHCTTDLLYFTCSVAELEINNVFKINDDLMEKCIEVRDNICSVEWRIAESFINISLPECESLSENFTTSRAPFLDCPDNFGIFCGSLCQPLCAEFSLSLLNDATAIASRAVHIILYLISIVGGLTTLLACYFHRDKMFRFPLIFVVYIVIALTVSCLLMILPYIFGPDNLLCSHTNLVVSYSRSTVFCQIQGFVIQTAGIVFFGFWLLHLSHLLYSLLYPFRSERLIKSVRYRRKVHTIELAIVLLCGVLPSIIICCTSGYRYTGFRLSCLYVEPEVLFYSFVFPISIGATIGLCILLISLKILKVHRNYKNAATNKSRINQVKFSTPETKLLILFSYYAITIVILLINLVINLWIIDGAAENVVKFIFCSAGGYKTECDVFKDRLHKILTPSIVSGLTTTVFLSFVNIVNLVYVIQFQDIKKAFKKLTMSPRTPAASETKLIT